MALLLAGGGEFAFVVFKLAEDLGVLPDQLQKLLTASVIISMALTPLLGELAEFVAGKLDESDGAATPQEGDGAAPTVEESQVAADAVVVCGYGRRAHLWSVARHAV